MFRCFTKSNYKLLNWHFILGTTACKSQLVRLECFETIATLQAYRWHMELNLSEHVSNIIPKSNSDLNRLIFCIAYKELQAKQWWTHGESILTAKKKDMLNAWKTEKSLILRDHADHAKCIWMAYSLPLIHIKVSFDLVPVLYIDSGEASSSNSIVNIEKPFMIKANQLTNSLILTKTRAMGLSLSAMKIVPSQPNHKQILVARHVSTTQLEVSDKHPHTHVQRQAVCISSPKL